MHREFNRREKPIASTNVLGIGGRFTRHSNSCVYRLATKVKKLYIRE